MEITGTIIKFFYQKPTWASFLLLLENGDTLNCSGNLNNPIVEEMKVKLIGDYSTYNGRPCFPFVELVPLEPYLIRFMAMTVRGVGESTARSIYQKFGENSLTVMRNTPEELLSISGIGCSKLDMIIESMENNHDIALTYQILTYFEGNITENQIVKIAGYCNKKNVPFSRIEENPYLLIGQIDGFGFKKVDKLAQSSGFDKFDIRRIEAGVVYALEESATTDGHCYLDLDTLCLKTCEIVHPCPDMIKGKTFTSLKSKIDEGEDEAVENVIKKYDENGVLKKWISEYKNLLNLIADAILNNKENDRIVIDEDRIYWSAIYYSEVTSANIIKSMANNNPIKKFESDYIALEIDEINETSDHRLSDEQIIAINNCLKNRISVLTGGPGRGKTTVLSSIVKIWNDKYSVICLAPTGKAAKRMEESMAKDGVKISASTIHRFLAKLEKNDCSINNSLIIVDECSMLGIKLASKLLKIAVGSQLILVGDVDQLSSIEAGNFMKDIIKSKKVVTTYLTRCFRNEGSILENANLINAGKVFKNLIFDNDTRFIDSDSSNVEKNVLNTYIELSKKYDPSEIGILTPLRQRGCGCVNNINKLFREKINHETSWKKECSLGFIVGDRVMNIQNNYDLSVYNETTKEKSVGVFNGDIGTVTDIDYLSDEIEITFDGKEKERNIGKWKFEHIRGMFVPAWAMTIHKSQGSEYKALIMVICSSQIYFLKRNLIYTGLTRAKEVATIIGDEKAMNFGIRKIDDKIRNTYLTERIKGEA